jgi:hypothetical protein
MEKTIQINVYNSVRLEPPVFVEVPRNAYFVLAIYVLDYTASTTLIDENFHTVPALLYLNSLSFGQGIVREMISLLEELRRSKWGRLVYKRRFLIRNLDLQFLFR